MNLKERYSKSFTYWTDANNGGWQDWFDADIPSELAFPCDTEFATDVVAEMLEKGDTFWNHPGWIRDLWMLIKDWAIKGMLIRVRLFSQWLLTTIPTEPLDTEICKHLQMLANGCFCEVFEGEYSIINSSISFQIAL